MGLSNSRSLESDKPLINVDSAFKPQDNRIVSSKEIEDASLLQDELEMKHPSDQKVKIPIQIEHLTGAEPLYLEFKRN